MAPGCLGAQVVLGTPGALWVSGAPGTLVYSRDSRGFWEFYGLLRSRDSRGSGGYRGFRSSRDPIVSRSSGVLNNGIAIFLFLIIIEGATESYTNLI